MIFETEKQKRTIQRWSRLAIQLNGAADSGRFDHITTTVMLQELQSDRGSIFDFLGRELPPTVWDISMLTDVDRHDLEKLWKIFAKSYEPSQFHVSRNGLAMLVAYVLHSLDTLHATTPS